MAWGESQNNVKASVVCATYLKHGRTDLSRAVGNESARLLEGRHLVRRRTCEKRC